MNKKREIVLKIIYETNIRYIRQSRIIGLTYLVSKNTNEINIDYEEAQFVIESHEIENILEDLTNNSLLDHKEGQTFGGNINNSYKITKRGENLIKDKNMDIDISDKIKLYENYPITNLMDELLEME